MKKLLAASLFVVSSASVAQLQNRALEEPSHVVPYERVTAQFSGVTAETGQDWLDQCERPANKSDSSTRNAACVSFIKGAIALAKSDKKKFCAASLNNQVPGALMDGSFYLARTKPNMSIALIIESTLQMASHGPCRKPM